MVDYFDSVAKNYGTLRFLPLKRLEMRKILEFGDFSKNDSVLDIGCGNGIYLRKIENKVGLSVGLDNSKEMIRQARKTCKRSRFIRADAENFSLKQKFDKILCLGILEFCKIPENVLENCSKHLKKKGKLIVLYPRANLTGNFYKLYHAIVSKKKIRLFRNMWIDNKIKKFKLRKIKQAEFLFSAISIYEKM